MMSVVTEKLPGAICKSSSEPPVAPSIAIVKLSSGSPSESSMVARLKDAVVWPAGIVTDAIPEKSTPLTAVPV